MLAAEFQRREDPLSRSRSLCDVTQSRWGSREQNITRRLRLSQKPPVNIYENLLIKVNFYHKTLSRREAPGGGQHAGAGPDPERQLGLLQPPVADPHLRQACGAGQWPPS